MDTKGMSVEDVLAMIELDRKIRELDLNKLVEEKQKKMTPLEHLVDELKAGVTTPRLRKKPKRMHYKTKQKKRREYYKRVVAPARLERKVELMSSGAAGWWKYMNHQWQQEKMPVGISFEEWEGIIWPAIDGRVFTVQRYDWKRGIELDNIFIVDTRASTGTKRVVLFDGKEHALREAGYIL